MAEKKSVITLNLGSQRVGMARFSLGGKGSLLLKNYAFANLHGDPTTDGTRKSALTGAVKELATALKAEDADVNYAVPGQFLISKFVKLPPLAEDQVDKIVGFEAQQAVPFPLAETVWDYQLMGKNAGEVEVGIVAIRSEHLSDLNSAVETAGLHTHIVDAAPVALYNAFRYNYPEMDGCSVLIDIGARTTDLIFIEGNRAFISSFQTGGASLSQAISKEMETDYDNAEDRKVSGGFVNLGGNYADHEDPEIDAMSKILRTAMTRIQSDIARRISAYRQQQGGGAPTNAFLCGGGASMPYIKEFFEEKLRIPVHYFNAFKNISVGPAVDPDAVGREAHTMGEMVGLALREMSCPMELDLAPKSVQASRDVGNRKPFLYTAAAALFAALLGKWAYNKSAAAGFSAQNAALLTETNGLKKFDSGIKEQELRQTKAAARADVLNRAVADQKYWVSLLNVINNAFKSDKIWVTQIQPVTAGGEPVTGKLFGESSENDNPFGSDAQGVADAKDPRRTIAALHVMGINRDDQPGGPLVTELFKRFVARDAPADSVMKNFFKFNLDLSEDKLLEEHLRNSVGDLANNDGYYFHMLLPLQRTAEVLPQAGLKATR